MVYYRLSKLGSPNLIPSVVKQSNPSANANSMINEDISPLKSRFSHLGIG